MSFASAMVEGAELRLRQPAECLRSYLGCFWTIGTSVATRLRSLPDACVTISCQVLTRGPARCFLVGPLLAPRERRPRAGQELFGVRLRPGVAFALVGVPMHKMAGRRITLEMAMPGQGSRLARSLGEAATAGSGSTFWSDSSSSGWQERESSRALRCFSNGSKKAAGKYVLRNWLANAESARGSCAGC